MLDRVIDALADHSEGRVEAIITPMERLVRSMGYRPFGPGAPSVPRILLEQKGRQTIVVPLVKPLLGRWWLYHRIQMTLGGPCWGAARAQSLSWWVSIWPTGANLHVQRKPGFFEPNAHRPAFPTRLKPRDRRLRRRFAVYCFNPAESLPVIESEPLRSAMVTSPEVDLVVRNDYLCFADLDVRLLGELGGLASEGWGEHSRLIPFRRQTSRYRATDARATAVLCAAIETLWSTQATRWAARRPGV